MLLTEEQTILEILLDLEVLVPLLLLLVFLNDEYSEIKLEM